jgi:TrmH family RNA methyltransferase
MPGPAGNREAYHRRVPTETGRLRRISSRQNPLVKDLRRAFHEGECTAEGYGAIESVRLIEEAIRSGLRFRAVFFSESARERADRLLPQISSHAEVVLLPDEVFASAVATESPQGVAALVRFKPYEIGPVLAQPDPLLLVAAGVQDPGNVGTMIRSAEAFGATAVLLGDGTVSQFNPKVVRASAGSLFRLPVIRIELTSMVATLRARSAKLLATSSHKGTELTDTDLRGPVAVFIGSEGAGLPRSVTQQIDETIVIRHSERVESLNAGIAASIVLYEASRQRRRG